MDRTPLILESFSREEFIFCATPEKKFFKIEGAILPTKSYVPRAHYIVSLVAGDDPKAWLVGELDSYYAVSNITCPSFTTTDTKRNHSGWKLTVEDPLKIWTCRLVGGDKYSLLVRPLEDGPNPFA